MEDVLLAKFDTPESSNVLLRKRLFRMIDKMRGSPVIWIKSPPGAGKTTLISSYLEYRKIPHIWYRMDQIDGEAASFFHYMGIAIRKFTNSKRKKLPVLTPEYMPGLYVFTQNYFRELFNIIKPPGIVVLDNYQDIGVNAQLHEILKTGITEIPAGINLIVISRNKPPSEMAKLHASSLISTIDWEDIRLTCRESLGIIRQNKKRCKMTEESLENLCEHTRGWAAGLILLLLQKKDIIIPDNINHLSAKNKNEVDTIFDYFAKEVFQNTEKVIQTFLLKTAFLPKIFPHVAEKLTGNHSAIDILNDLTTDSYFTVVHTSSVPSYEYHPLYRAFLIRQAELLFTSDELRKIKEEAAELLIGNGENEDAVPLLIDASNWDMLVNLLIKIAPEIIKQGRNHTLLSWLERIPTDVYENIPWILFWYGIAQLPFIPEHGRNLLNEAFRRFKEHQDSAGAFLAWSSIVESLTIGLNNLKELDTWIPMMNDLLKLFSAFPTPDIEARAAAIMFMAMVYRQPAHPAIEKWKKRALDNACISGNDGLTALTISNDIFNKINSGRLKEGKSYIDHYRSLTRTLKVRPVAMLAIRWIEAMYFAYTGSHEECKRVVNEGLNIASSTGMLVMNFLLAGQGCLSALDAGDFDTADSLLKIIEATSFNSVCGKGYYQYLLAYKAILTNDFEKAEMHTGMALMYGQDTGFPVAVSLCYLEKAYVLYELRNHKEAWQHLRKGIRICKKARYKYAEFLGLLTAAHFHFTEGAEKKGAESLGKSLRIGRGCGYINTYTLPPDTVAKLCSNALRHGIETGYVQDLIKKRSLNVASPFVNPDARQWKVKIYTLSKFNIEIDGKAVILNKIPRKPLELLLLLLTSEDMEISDVDAGDILWPDSDGDKAYRAFKSTLHRLRYQMGIGDILNYKNHKLTIDTMNCWIDSWAFEKTLETARQVLKGGSKEKALKMIENALRLYKNVFLLNCYETPWTVSKREKLKEKYTKYKSLLESNTNL